MRPRDRDWVYRVGVALWVAMTGCGDGGGGTPDAADEGDADRDGEVDRDADAEETIPDDGPGGDDTIDAEADAAEPGWQPPAEWRRPIDDYIDAVLTTMGLPLDGFDHALKELEVFDGRLYIGYGDWTQNTGRAVGMHIRYFDDPEGDAITEFSIEEESIDYYRIWNDTLYIPGVDATEDALVGNVYLKPSGGTWTKVRELQHNLHVIDVFGHEGVLYASGGGCDDMTAYSAGDDQGVLYRSADGGRTWAIDFEWHDGVPEAVVRYEYFAGVEGDFYVFGNTINTTTRTLTNIPRRWDGGAWTEVTLLPAVWIHRAYQLDAARAVVRGVDLGTGRFRAFRVMAGESTRAVSVFDTTHQRPLDYFSVAPGDMFVLGREGNAYPDTATPPFTYPVYRTTDLFSMDYLFSFESDLAFVCLAFWNDALYLGAADGSIWRSTYAAP